MVWFVEQEIGGFRFGHGDQNVGDTSAQQGHEETAEVDKKKFQNAVQGIQTAERFVLTIFKRNTAIKK